MSTQSLQLIHIDESNPQIPKHLPSPCGIMLVNLSKSPIEYGGLRDVFTAIAGKAEVVHVSIDATSSLRQGDVLSPFGQLESLLIYRSGPFDLRSIPMAPVMRSLSLNNKAKDRDLTAISAYTSLQEINLSHPSKGELEILATVATLKRLSFDHCAIVSIDDSLLSPSLQEVQIYQSKTTNCRTKQTLSRADIIRCNDYSLEGLSAVAIRVENCKTINLDGICRFVRKLELRKIKSGITDWTFLRRASHLSDLFITMSEAPEDGFVEAVRDSSLSRVWVTGLSDGALRSVSRLRENLVATNGVKTFRQGAEVPRDEYYSHFEFPQV